jgi:hypothetical protein
MSGERTGQVAVIFTSVRTPDDDSGYGAAAEAMERSPAIAVSLLRAALTDRVSR